MMQKAQVFSLEKDSAVRNRLTHSLEVSDIGRSIARSVATKLYEAKRIKYVTAESIQLIVENACLIHDVGNPPFGHFGEEAIKKWFSANGKLSGKTYGINDSDIIDLMNFDGNPQGLRILTKLHNECDDFGLNLTASTLLASIKYPNWGGTNSSTAFKKKIGIFDSELETYRNICAATNHPLGKRYFLAYLMELADDICYCLSDIADGFEKKIFNASEFATEYNDICASNGLSPLPFSKSGKEFNYNLDFSVKFSQGTIREASDLFSKNVDEYILGDRNELSVDIQMGRYLDCLKMFARKYIYSSREAQSIEIAGYKIMTGLLEHYGMLLLLSRDDFNYFVEKSEMPKGRNLDFEWRVFNQLPNRFIQSYRRFSADKKAREEWIVRARLIVDYLSGLTDQSALLEYQNFMGISL